MVDVELRGTKVWHRREPERDLSASLKSASKPSNLESYLELQRLVGLWWSIAKTLPKDHLAAHPGSTRGGRHGLQASTATSRPEAMFLQSKGVSSVEA
jgi:hypothetical protein